MHTHTHTDVLLRVRCVFAPHPMKGKKIEASSVRFKILSAAVIKSEFDLVIDKRNLIIDHSDR